MDRDIYYQGNAIRMPIFQFGFGDNSLFQESRTISEIIFGQDRKVPKFSIGVAKDVARHSFIVHKSLTGLDLNLSEFSNNKKWRNELDSYRMGTSKSFIYTEETCRKRLARNRQVMYVFHLDVSKRLELSLRNNQGQKFHRCFSRDILLNRLSVKHEFYEMQLNKMITNVVKESDQKVKMLLHVCKVMKRLTFIRNNGYVSGRGLYELYFQRADPTAVKEFLTAMDYEDDYFVHTFYQVFEFILHQAQQSGYTMWPPPPREDLINASITRFKFEKTALLLQYRNAPRFCQKSYDTIKSRINSSSLGLSDMALEIPFQRGLITKERYFLLLQIFYIFCNRRSEGLKGLQMLWRAIPDPLINLEELVYLFPQLENTGYLDKIHTFIKDVTGEEALVCQPRKLKHYCRTCIRKVLSDNKQLATGIGGLKLPNIMESYVRCEI